MRRLTKGLPRRTDHLKYEKDLRVPGSALEEGNWAWVSSHGKLHKLSAHQSMIWGGEIGRKALSMKTTKRPPISHRIRKPNFLLGLRWMIQCDDWCKDLPRCVYLLKWRHMWANLDDLCIELLRKFVDVKYSGCDQALQLHENHTYVGVSRSALRLDLFWRLSQASFSVPLWANHLTVR